MANKYILVKIDDETIKNKEEVKINLRHLIDKETLKHIVNNIID